MNVLYNEQAYTMNYEQRRLKYMKIERLDDLNSFSVVLRVEELLLTSD